MDCNVSDLFIYQTYLIKESNSLSKWLLSGQEYVVDISNILN